MIAWHKENANDAKFEGKPYEHIKKHLMVKLNY